MRSPCVPYACLVFRSAILNVVLVMEAQTESLSILLYETGASEAMSAKSLDTVQLLDLGRQQRNLLLMRPVFDLEARKHLYSSPVDDERRLFDHIDTSYLVLCLLDYLMEAVAVDSGRSTKEVIRHLAQLAFTMQPELREEECIQLGQIVLDAIANGRDKHKEFEFEFYDAASKSMRAYRFKLVEYIPDISDTFRFVPTREGYLVYLGMLDLAPEDAAELMEKMLQLLIERGRFFDAIEVAKKARTISIEYSQKIRDMILRARKAPSTVNWKSEIAPKLHDARTHVGRRQAEDARMNESVQQNLNTAYDRQVRANLLNLKSVIQSAAKVRSRLLHDVMVAPEQFLEAQRSLFKTKTESNLPNLENIMLPEIMRLPVSDLASLAEPILSAFMPAKVKRVFDLNTAMMVLLEKREIASEPELDDGEIIEVDDLKTMFSEDEIKSALYWLEEKLHLISQSTSESILKAALSDGLSTEVCQCIALLLYQSFNDASPMRAFDISATDTRFKLPIAYGRNMILQRRNENSHELQS